MFSHDSSGMLIGDLFDEDESRHAPQLQAATTSPLPPSSSISPTLSSDFSVDLHQVPTLPFDVFESSMVPNLAASPPTTGAAFVSDAPPSAHPAAALPVFNHHQTASTAQTNNFSLINLKTNLPPLNLALDCDTVIQAWKEISGHDRPVGCPASAAEAVVPTFNFPTAQQLQQSLLPETIEHALRVEQQQHQSVGRSSQYQYNNSNTKSRPPLPNNRSKNRKSAKNRFPGRKARYEVRRINAEKRPRYKGRFVSKAELEALVAAGLCNEAGLSTNNNDNDDDNEQQQYSDNTNYDDGMSRHDSAGLLDAVVPSSIDMNFP